MDIAPELVELIASYVSTYDDFKAMSLTCTKWHSILQSEKLHKLLTKTRPTTKEEVYTCCPGIKHLVDTTSEQLYNKLEGTFFAGTDLRYLKTTNRVNTIQVKMTIRRGKLNGPYLKIVGCIYYTEMFFRNDVRTPIMSLLCYNNISKSYKPNFIFTHERPSFRLKDDPEPRVVVNAWQFLRQLVYYTKSQNSKILSFQAPTTNHVACLYTTHESLDEIKQTIDRYNTSMCEYTEIRFIEPTFIEVTYARAARPVVIQCKFKWSFSVTQIESITQTPTNQRS